MSLTKHQYSTLPIIISEMILEEARCEPAERHPEGGRGSGPLSSGRSSAPSEDGQRKEMEKAGMKVNDVTDMTALPQGSGTGL